MVYEVYRVTGNKTKQTNQPNKKPNPQENGKAKRLKLVFKNQTLLFI
jgi:hypothetical protein